MQCVYLNCLKFYRRLQAGVFLRELALCVNESVIMEHLIALFVMHEGLKVM